MAQLFGQMEHRITLDLVKGTVTQHIKKRALSPSTSVDGLTTTSITTESSFTISDTDPAEAVLTSECHCIINRQRSPEVSVCAEEVLASDISSFRYVSEVTVKIDGKQHFHKCWRVSVLRKLD
jgi:hypothetical protein